MDAHTPLLAWSTLFYGPWLSHCVYVAVKWQLADALQEHALTMDQLAQRLQVPQASVTRLVRVLISFGFLTEQSETLTLTPAGQRLCVNAENSLAHYILINHEVYLPLWQNLEVSLLDASALAPTQWGENFYDYIHMQPSLNEIYNKAMAERYAHVETFIIDNYHFKLTDTVLDIGGGDGRLAQAITEKYNIPCLILELETVARAQVEALNYISGDMFDSIPTEIANIFVLKFVLHNYEDTEVLQLLNNCHQALPDSGTLLLIEQLVTPGKEGDYVLLHDLHMLLLHGGRERSLSSLMQLATQSGFTIIKQTRHANTSLVLLELIKV